MFYLEYYLMGIILLPGLILAAYAQYKVETTFSTYKKRMSRCDKTAAEVARILLDMKGLQHIKVREVPGHLTDNYNFKTQTISLSQSVYSSKSVASIGVAAHEVGHAYQYAENYLPIKIRNIVIPIANISSMLLWPLAIIGLLLNFAFIPNSIIGKVIIWSAIAVFMFAVIIDLVTLPCEYNASNRAVKTLKATGLLETDELYGAKAVLKSAALTYVASLLVSILNLLRFLIVIARYTSDNN